MKKYIVKLKNYKILFYFRCHFFYLGTLVIL